MIFGLPCVVCVVCIARLSAAGRRSWSALSVCAGSEGDGGVSYQPPPPCRAANGPLLPRGHGRSEHDLRATALHNFQVVGSSFALAGRAIDVRVAVTTPVARRTDDAAR